MSCARSDAVRKSPSTLGAGAFEEEDGALEHLYIHDDALGPNVRFALETSDEAGGVVLSRVHRIRVAHRDPLRTRRTTWSSSY